MSYVVDPSVEPPIIAGPFSEPPTSYDGYYVPLVSEPPSFNPATEALEQGALQVEFEEGVPVRVRRLWSVRNLTADELDSAQLDSELALIQQLIDAHIATRDILAGSPTNGQILAAVRQNNITVIKILRYIKRDHGT